MASTEPRTPPLPFEITENIIQLYLGGPYTFPDSHFPPDLAPLLLICKAWHEYGERQLYRSISITEDGDDSEAIGVVLLSATLSQNSRLANLVRFFTFESECFGIEHARAITQIISLSSNLTHLSITRMDGLQEDIDARVAERLRHALIKRSLKHFQLQWFNQSDPLYPPNETLALMANWPDLEEFSVYHGSASPNPFEFPTETPVRFLALRHVELKGLNIACVVAKMAPFVEDANITHGNLVDMEDLACLHTWSETLTRLTLYILRGEIRYFPPLRKLRYFYCKAPVVHPRCFESMDSLEELVYCMLPEQAKQLVNCVREGAGSGDFLPALKVFRFRPYLPAKHCKRREILWMEPLRTALKPFEEICAQRSISFSAYDDEEYY